MGINESLCNCKCDLPKQEDLEMDNNEKNKIIKDVSCVSNNVNIIDPSSAFKIKSHSQWYQNNRKVNKDTNDFKVIRLQSFIRGFLYRNIFPHIKTTLESLETKKIECFKLRFQIQNSPKTEEIKGEFNPDSWKKFYPSTKEDLFKYNEAKYGKLYPCKILTYKDVSYYIGTVNIKYQRSGQGMLTDISGVKTVGNWREDMLNGWGRIVDSEGVLTEGYFVNHYLNGKGEKYYPDGTKYIGDFVKGLRQGNGEEENEEHIYKGQFMNDKKEGTGTLKYKAKDDVYNGEFKNNSITGKGKYIWANKDVYEGNFLNGKMHGKGKYVWADGDEYEGDYVEGLKEGVGVFKWSNGKIYSGTFYKGKPHGKGLFFSEEKKYDVVFVDGRMTQSNLITSK